jgi:hypothetical protein
VIDLPVLAAVAVVIGGVAAVTARDGRIVVLGLMFAAAASALTGSPLPGWLAVSARILAALLAGYLLWTAAGLRASAVGHGSALGPVGAAAAALAAFVVGFVVRPVDLDGLVSQLAATNVQSDTAALAAAQAAGTALVVLAIVPLAGRDVYRAGLGVALLAVGCSLLIGAWSGPMPGLEHLALAALLVGIAGATNLLIPMPQLADEAADAAEAARLALYAMPGRTAGPSVGSPLARKSTAPAAGAIADSAPLSRRPRPTDSPPAPKAQPEPRTDMAPAARRPMTADPIEDDAWAAWTAAEPSRGPEHRSPGAHRVAPPQSGDAPKPEPKKPATRSRPNLGGKP